MPNITRQMSARVTSVYVMGGRLSNSHERHLRLNQRPPIADLREAGFEIRRADVNDARPVMDAR